MRALAVAATVSLALLAAAGCKKKETGDPVAKEIVSEADKTKTAACGCKDIACADQALADHDTWDTTNHDRNAAAKLDAKQQHAIDGALADARACADKLGDPLAAEILAKLRGFRDATCACTDKKCADDQMNDQGKWLLDNQAKFAPTKSSHRQEAEANALAAATQKCAADVEAKSPAPSTPPKTTP